MSWPELVRFDEIACRIESLVRIRDFDSAREVLPELSEAGEALTTDSVPAYVQDPEQVEMFFADLISLVEALDSDGGDDEVLRVAVLGIHPVVDKLIGAAGMPHVHGQIGPNGGFLHPVFDGQGNQIGSAEIKLHHDVDDLENWLGESGYGSEAWRLPPETRLELDYSDMQQIVGLAVMDREKKSGEFVDATIQEMTNAFLISAVFNFPGERGAGASRPVKREFVAKAELRLVEATAGSFVLSPHFEGGDGE